MLVKSILITLDIGQILSGQILFSIGKGLDWRQSIAYTEALSYGKIPVTLEKTLLGKQLVGFKPSTSLTVVEYFNCCYRLSHSRRLSKKEENEDNNCLVNPRLVGSCANMLNASDVLGQAVEG